MITALFAVAVVAIPTALGAPLIRVHSLRSLSLPARVAVAWAGGILALTVLLTLLSAVGLSWTPWPIAVLAVLSFTASRRLDRSAPVALSREPSMGRGTAVAVLCVAVVAGAGLLQFSTGAATSADLAYMWGVKAVHFALERGIGFQWMQLPHLAHLHPTYPPLWPVSLAWGVLVSGTMPWTAVPQLTWLFLTATALIIHSLLRKPLGRRGAMVVCCLWFAVLTGSTVRSFSGGNAEGPLLLFVTVAVTVLAVEKRDEEPELRWLAAGALAGAVLTKNEGAVAAAFVVTGTAIRDGIWHRPAATRAITRLAAPAIAAIGLWAAIRFANGLPITDPVREPALHLRFGDLEVIFKVCARLLGEGVSWLGWSAPLLAALVTRPLHPLRVLPGLAVAAGLPAFAVFYYLHAGGHPVGLIVWTFPRLILPALSAWIVCLGVLCFKPRNAATRDQSSDAAVPAVLSPAPKT